MSKPTYEELKRQVSILRDALAHYSSENEEPDSGEIADAALANTTETDRDSEQICQQIEEAVKAERDANLAIAKAEMNKHNTGSGFDSQPSFVTAHNIFTAIRERGEK